MDYDELQRRVMARRLAPAVLLPVGQLRIATIPSQRDIALARLPRLPVAPEILAEWLTPLPARKTVRA
jgi:hypothetical protein